MSVSAEGDETARHGLIVLTGATGYVGGVLRQALEARHLAVRCLVRNPEKLADKCAPTTQVLQADLLRPETLTRALESAETAYYLVHSMSDAGDFAVADRLAAENFARAAKSAGVRRIIYLGGLGGDSPQDSRHLRSRREVGDILRRHGPQVIEFVLQLFSGPAASLLR